MASCEPQFYARGAPAYISVYIDLLRDSCQENGAVYT